MKKTVSAREHGREKLVEMCAEFSFHALNMLEHPRERQRQSTLSVEYVQAWVQHTPVLSNSPPFSSYLLHGCSDHF